MSDETPLDRAHAAMEAAPEDDAARLRFFERLADAELLVMLVAEADGDTIDPETFEIEGGPVILAFDREDRLAEFAGRIVPYAALSGRALAGMLAGQGLGLGLNLGVAPSSILLPAGAMTWLVETLANRPAEVTERPVELERPGSLPEVLLSALDAKLPAGEGLASHAYLAGATYEGGRRGHVLAFVDALEGAEGNLAQAVGEALIFSGLDAGELDVCFLSSSDPLADRLARVALRFDIPQPADSRPAAPGTDPDRPPRLR